MVALLAPAPNSSLMAGLRARLNNCCAIVSNIQPMLATLSTNQWYPVNSRHHAYFCPPAPSTVGDMKLLFYIVALTRSPAFSSLSAGSATAALVSRRWMDKPVRICCATTVVSSAWGVGDLKDGTRHALGQRIQLIGVYRRSSAAKPECRPNAQALKNDSL